MLREEKQKEREARKKRRQLTYETYIDSNNEMKVRLPKSSAGGKSSPVKIESTKNSRTAPTVPKVAPIAMLPNQEIKPKPVEEKTPSAPDSSGTKQQKPLRSIAPARGSQHQCSVARCAVRLVDEEKLMGRDLRSVVRGEDPTFTPIGFIRPRCSCAPICESASL